MIISFWSPLHGQACTTANMLGAAVISALGYSKNTLITQTHFNLNNLDYALMGKISDKEFYRDTGIDALIKNIKSAPINDEMIDSCSISLLKNKLALLIGTRQLNRFVFEEEAGRMILKILKEVEKHYELVLIDTNSGIGKITNTVLQESDIVVVNLRQNKSMIDTFFESDHPFDLGKAFYLLGSYDKDSRFNINNIRRKYPMIKKGNSGVVPYNIEYSDSFSDGSLLKYVSRNIKISEDSTDDYFFKCLGSTVEKIYKKAGIEL